MSNIKAPWCSTCGKDVHTIECEKCAQWWVALDLEKLEMKAEIEQLREALGRMIYETTSLSPLEDDGSHWCKISGEALSLARAALNQKNI